MKIYITTSGRVAFQRTLNTLPESLRKQTTLIVQEQEFSAYKEKYADQCKAVVALPKKIKTLSPTRDWIVYEYHNIKKDGTFLVLLDDDLKFDTRRKDDPEKFLTSKPKEIETMFKYIGKELNSGIAHVGVLSREGGNRVLANRIFNKRPSLSFLPP